MENSVDSGQIQMAFALFSKLNKSRLSQTRITVVPTKNDSDVILCLQLLSKALTCDHHLS